MRKLNLSALSASELQALKGEIDKELATRETKLQALEEIKQLATSKGLKFDELLTELGFSKGGTRAKLGPAPIRFRHPDNASLTWSGRGKRPRWMNEALSSGFTEAQLKI
jgi:DNA-binding protein H-NS